MNEKEAEKVGLGGAIANFFRNYVTFTGRSSRSEYWFMWLFSGFLLFPFLLLLMVAEEIATPLFGLYSFGVLLPSLALTVRRLRDIGVSPYAIFVVLIPFFGLLLVAVVCVLRSDAALPSDASETAPVSSQRPPPPHDNTQVLNKVEEIQNLFDRGLIDEEQMKAAKNKALGI
jgi:uncharacterized membrane protein YhaH (DUF805 family)